MSAPLPVPVPPGFEKSLTSGKVPLSEDPQSGSILKVLMENGFKDKIENGLSKGHTYNILHAAPSTDFTLVETWNETIQGPDGTPVATPRKSYQFFKITDGGETAPAPDKIPDPAPLPPEEPEKPAATPAPDPAPKPDPANTPVPTPAPERKVPDAPKAAISPDMIPATAPEDPSGMAREIAAKIRNGGAGMTPSDWQFRNENWPAIEKFLLSKPAEASVPAPAPEAPIPPVPPTEATAATAATAQIVQHHEAKNWLMERLGQGRVPAEKTGPAAKSDTEPAGPSSYDLLKARFAQGTPKAVQENIPSPDPKKALLESVFGGPVEGEALESWNLAKNIPARPFIYPTEYSWGTDSDGNPVERSLENYPQPAKRLRERMAETVEKLSRKGIDIETVSIGEAVEKAAALGLI